MDDPGGGPCRRRRPQHLRLHPHHLPHRHRAADAGPAGGRHHRRAVRDRQLHLQPGRGRAARVRQPDAGQRLLLDADRAERHRGQPARLRRLRQLQHRRQHGAGAARGQLHAQRAGERPQDRRVRVPPAGRVDRHGGRGGHARHRHAGRRRGGHRRLPVHRHGAGTGGFRPHHEQQRRHGLALAGPVREPGVRPGRAGRQRAADPRRRDVHPPYRRIAGTGRRRQLRLHDRQRAAADGQRADHAGLRHARAAALRAGQQQRRGGHAGPRRHRECVAADRRRRRLPGQRRVFPRDQRRPASAGHGRPGLHDQPARRRPRLEPRGGVPGRRCLGQQRRRPGPVHQCRAGQLAGRRLRHQ